MENKKMTYAQALANAIEVVTDEETKARLADLQKSLEKKKSNKKSVDNSEWFEKVRDALADGGMSPSDLMKAIDAPNTQKVTAIVKDMGAEIVRDVKGKKVTYKLA